MKKVKITERILGKFGIKNVVTGSFATETEQTEGHLSFTRYPAVFDTEEDAKTYMEICGVFGDPRYIVEELVAVNWKEAILVTFDDVAKVERINDETKNNKLIEALRLIRKICKEQGNCTNCPLRLGSDTCSVTHKCPEKWILVGDDPNEADMLFV